MLVHYIIVRRDLPVGVLASMVAHAAGESACVFQNYYNDPFPGATAVVLEAKTEADLYEDAAYLKHEHMAFVPIHETGGPYNGEFMAIGLVPCERESSAEIMKDFQTLKSCVAPYVVLRVRDEVDNPNPVVGPSEIP